MAAGPTLLKGMKNAEPDQRRLVGAILDRDYTSVHMIFLKDADHAASDKAQFKFTSNFPVGKHNTPLILATRMGDPRMVRLLLKEGSADANYPNAMGLPALFYVFEEWRMQVLHKIPGRDSLKKMLDRAKDVITELGKASANVNAIDHLGSTPVHMAAALHTHGTFSSCSGFDPTIRNNVGQSRRRCPRTGQARWIVLTEWPKIRGQSSSSCFETGGNRSCARRENPSDTRCTRARQPRSCQTSPSKIDEVETSVLSGCLAFETSARFVRDDDDVSCGDGADMDEMTATTEVIMSSMRRALSTMGDDVNRKTEKELRDERQKVAAPASALKEKFGGDKREAA